MAHSCVDKLEVLEKEVKILNQLECINQNLVKEYKKQAKEKNLIKIKSSIGSKNLVLKMWLNTILKKHFIQNPHSFIS